MQRGEELCEGRADARGITSGLPEFDELLCPIAPGELCIIAARPGSGKSVLLQQIAATAAERQSGTLYVSSRCPPADLADRDFARAGRVPLSVAQLCAEAHRARRRLAATAGSLS